MQPAASPCSLLQLSQHLLPLHAVQVRARFSGYSQPSVFHEPALGALLKTLAGGDLEQEPLLGLQAPESGRSSYAAGDTYHFDLWAAHPAAHKLPPLLQALRTSARQAPRDPRVPFGSQFAVSGFHDPSDGEPLQGAQAVPFYTTAQLQLELGFWRTQPRLRVRLHSPLRILRNLDERGDTKGEGRFVCDAGGLTRCFLPRLWASLAHFAQHLGLWLDPAPAAPVVDGVDVFYIDWDQRSGSGSKPMGGLLGWVDLDMRGAGAEWWLALLLVQRLGMGQRRNFGWGRYRLECPQGRGTLPPRQRSRSLIERASSADNRREAVIKALEANDCPEELAQLSPADLRAGQPLPEAWQQRIDGAFELLGEGRYPAPALQGHVLFDARGKARPLAVPPWQDRVLQRAVHQVLATDLEPLMNASSFGYRRGRSRFDVKQHIQRLSREGYRWYFEADIRAFFDSIDLQRIHTRLAAVLGDEPALPMLMQWMSAPVEYLGRRIERSRGLPQGAPLSPLLANLVLEDLDASLEREGLRLLRYADDFVVLCRQPADAERARDLAQQRLDVLGLELKPARTRIDRLDQEGLEFLGFRFVGDLAVARARPVPATAPPLQIPESSWLAELLRREPALWPTVEARYRGTPAPDETGAAAPDSSAARRINPAPAVTQARPLVPAATAEEPTSMAPARIENGFAAAVPAGPGAAISPMSADTADTAAARAKNTAYETDGSAAESGWGGSEGPEGADALSVAEATEDEGQWLCLVEPCLLAQRHGRLCVLDDRQGGRDFAWPSLDGVLVFGPARLTSGAVTAALEHAVPIHFLGGPDGYRGCLSGPAPTADALERALLQQQRLREPGLALDLARALVEARLHNQRANLRQRQRGQPGADDLQHTLATLMQRAAHSHDRAELNGLEGAGARLYFSALAGALPPPFRFDGRSRRPPRDPVNALLSLGYTVLYTRTAGLLQAAGLLPRLGFYHQAHGRHATLASDLMEPFRHLVERSAWTVLCRRELRPEDFSDHPEQGCRLSPAAKRRYLGRLAEAFARRQTIYGDDSHGNFYELMRRQARALRAAIEQRGPAWFYRLR